MKSLNRYIFLQVLIATFVVTAGLTFAVWLTQSLRLIDYIVNRGLPVMTFLSFVALLLPAFIAVVLPIATFVSVLFIYNKLTIDSEMVVMRAAGMSQLQLSRPALLLAGICTLIVYSMSLYLQPIAYSAFKDLQHSIRNNYSSLILQEGEFNTLGDNITVYVRDRLADGQLRSILIHDTRKQNAPVTMFAASGALIHTEIGPRVVLKDGNRQEIDQENGRLSLLYFDSYTVELDDLDDSIPYRWRGPSERFVHELLNPGKDRLDVEHRAELIAEGHHRIVSPLYTLAFVMVALSALLSGEFNRRGQLLRIVTAVLGVCGLEALSLALRDLAIRDPLAIYAMYLVVALAFGLCFVLLYRKPQKNRATPRQSEGAQPV